MNKKNKDMKWYVLRVISGKEKKVKELLDKQMNDNDVIKSYVKRVILPLEKIYKVKNNKRYTIERNLYQGYILVETEMNGEIQHVIEKFPNIIQFLKEKDTPIPLRQTEINRLLSTVDDINNQTESEIPFIVGESVQIISGPFVSFYGKIISIDTLKEKVILIVKIFGRDTKLELGFLEINNV